MGLFLWVKYHLVAFLKILSPNTVKNYRKTQKHNFGNIHINSRAFSHTFWLTPMKNFPQTPLNSSWNIEPVAPADVGAIPIPGMCLSCASLLRNWIGKKCDQSIRLSDSAVILQMVWCCWKDHKHPANKMLTFQRSPSRHQGPLAFSAQLIPFYS